MKMRVFHHAHRGVKSAAAVYSASDRKKPRKAAGLSPESAAATFFSR